MGAGTMGSGIALAFASAGMPVTLYEPDLEIAERGLQRIGETRPRMKARGKMSAPKAEAAMARITATSAKQRRQRRTDRRGRT